MAGEIIIDTGPLYAFFNRRDQWHRWVGEQFGNLMPPFITCEAIISETVFLLQQAKMGSAGLMKLIERNYLIIKPAFVSLKEQDQIQSILSNYQDLPASFGDSCLVNMAEKEKKCKILTLDSDFSIYRTSKGEPLSLISPFLE